MKIGLKILFGTVLMLLCVTNLYAQTASSQQIVVLDPVCSYEVQEGKVFNIPVGANFLLPGPINEHEFTVSGAKVYLNITEKTYFRTAGFIEGQLSRGDYYLSIVALDKKSGARTQATLKLRVSPTSNLNAPIIFDPLEQIKTLKRRRWYSIAVGVSDADPEELTLQVTGAVNGLGYARFIPQNSSPGRAGGTLILYMFRPGELKVNLSARDARPARYGPNQSIAELHFLVE